MKKLKILTMLLTALFLSRQAAGLGPHVTRYEGLSRAETAMQLLRQRGSHLADITVVPLYDHYKWERKKLAFEKYAREHEAFPVESVKECRVKSEGFAVCELSLAGGGGAELGVSFPGPETARVRLCFSRCSSGNRQNHRPGKIELEKSGAESFQIRGGKALVQVFISGSSALVEVRSLAGGPALRVSGLAPGSGLSRAVLKLEPEEIIIGGGEQYTSFNHRNKILIMDTDDAYQTMTGNTYLPVPFFLSSRGWGLLLDTYRMARFDLDKKQKNAMTIENPGPELDLYFFLSRDPLEIMAGLTEVIGRPYLIPRWVLEPWISRRTRVGWRYDFAAEKNVDTMLELGFPLGVVMYENMTMTDENGVDLRVNRKTKPDMPRIINKWHELGIKVAGYQRAGQMNTNPRNLAYYGLDQHPEYLVRNPDGTPYVGGIGGDKVFLDITHPEVLPWFWQEALSPLFTEDQEGGSSFAHLNLDGTKVDFCEFFPGDTVPLLMRQREPGMRLRYPDMLSEWLYLKLNEVRPEGGITWVRGGGKGANKSGMVWAGDRGRTFPQFRHTLIAGLNLAASGIALWGTDLGGYVPGGLREEEVYNRAVAFSCFSPSFHDHGDAIAAWEQSERGKDIYRYYARLRYNLIPYLYSLVWTAHERGIPPIRPLPLVCPEERTCWQTDDEYLLGPSLLVAPVVKHARSRKVFLPPGEWMDFFTRELHQGPAWIDYPVPRERIPVFARAGHAIPVQLNRTLTLGGAFPQDEKNRLLPAFLVFGKKDMELEGSWKTEDPRVSKELKRELSLESREGRVMIEKVRPRPAAIILFGPLPEEVYLFREEVPRVDCNGLTRREAPGWCIQEPGRGIPGADSSALIWTGPAWR